MKNEVLFNQKKYSKIKIAILSIILITSLSISFYYSLHINLGTSEYEHIHASWKISVGEKIYTGFFENHHPLFYLLFSPLISASGNSVKTIFVLRIIIYAIYLLILLFVFKIGQTIFNSEIGLFAIIFLSGTPIFVQKTLEIGPEAIMILFYISSIYYLLLYLRSIRSVARNK